MNNLLLFPFIKVKAGQQWIADKVSSVDWDKGSIVDILSVHNGFVEYQYISKHKTDEIQIDRVKKFKYMNTLFRDVK